MLEHFLEIIIIAGAALISLEVYAAVYQNVIIGGISRKDFSKLATTIVGGIVLILGAALSLPLVPGPGFLLLILGFSILSREYPWAKRPLVWLKEKFSRQKNKKSPEQRE